jgi:hypothetical protein
MRHAGASQQAMGEDLVADPAPCGKGTLVAELEVQPAQHP